jgi:hypothetical protein
MRENQMNYFLKMKGAFVFTYAEKVNCTSPYDFYIWYSRIATALNTTVLDT